MTATLLRPPPTPVLPDFPTPPDTACACGGLLIYVGSTRVNLVKSAQRRALRIVMLVEHVEACEDCLDGGDPRECRWLHESCAAPEAVQCQHHGCHADTRPPTAPACARMHLHCCGCCWVEIYGED